MLVHIFLASAERGGVEEVGQGVWTRAEAGEKPAVRLSHVTKPTAPSRLHSPFMKSDIVVGGNSRAFPLGFQPEVTFHSFNWLL